MNTGQVTYITHTGKGIVIAASEGISIMQLATSNAVPGIDAECGGSLSCATCHVYMDEKTFAQLPEQNEEESEVIEFMEKVEATSRLACQVKLTEAFDGMTVTVAQEEGF